MIAIDRLSVRAGAFALDDISLRVETGQYCVLMGRTGSGKSTLLESICGLRPICGGRIHLMGRDVTRLKSAERGVGYVPQDGAVFSTMTVRENLAFALRVRRWSPEAMRKRVAELAELLGIEALLDRRPQGLSGGEAQRVALGRALAHGPGVLCMDEPLSALDEETLEEMYDLIGAVRRHTGVTALHVTHRLAEAERLADRVVMIQDGRIVDAEGAAASPTAGGPA